MTEPSTSRFDELRSRNLFDELLELRDEQRRRSPQLALIKGEELPWERNAHGVMRWYLHPTIDDTAHVCEIMYEQRIPPRSRSGRQFQQGGGVFFVLSGSGETMIDEKRYSWDKGDVLQLPIRADGITFQHFNGSSETEARILYASANFTRIFGVDAGSGFEQLAEASTGEDNGEN